MDKQYKQRLYNSFYEFEEYLPEEFLEAIKNKTLFDDKTLMEKFETWCMNQIENYNEALKASYEKRSDIEKNLMSLLGVYLSNHFMMVRFYMQNSVAKTLFYSWIWALVS